MGTEVDTSAIHKEIAGLPLFKAASTRCPPPAHSLLRLDVLRAEQMLAKKVGALRSLTQALKALIDDPQQAEFMRNMPTYTSPDHPNGPSYQPDILHYLTQKLDNITAFTPHSGALELSIVTALLNNLLNNNPELYQTHKDQNGQPYEERSKKTFNQCKHDLEHCADERIGEVLEAKIQEIKEASQELLEQCKSPKASSRAR